MDFLDAPDLSRSELEAYNERKKQQALEAQQAADQEEAELEPELEDTVAPGATPASVAKDPSIQKAQLERGPVTDIGEAVEYLATGGFTDDAVNALFAGANQLTGGRLQGLDDAVGGYDENKAREAAMFTELQQKQQAGELSPVESAALGTAQIATGISEGAVAGAMLPATLVARLAGQQASWADTPVHLKGNKAADAAFKITEIVLPTLLIPGGGPASSLKAGLSPAAFKFLGVKALESGVEAVGQRGADDIILGRTLSRALGDIADSLGFDGAQLTQDLIQGKKPNAQAIVAIGGFFQNMGINIAGDAVVELALKKLASRGTRKAASATSKGTENTASSTSTTKEEGGGLSTTDKRIPRDRRLPRAPQPRLPGQKGLPPDDAIVEVNVEVIDDATKRTAEVLKQSPEEVKKAVGETFEAPYVPTKEPFDVQDASTTVPTQKPSKASGNKFVGEESLIRRIVVESKNRKKPVDASGLTSTDRDYFTNWEMVTGNKEIQQVLREVAKGYKRLDPQSKEIAASLEATARFWVENKSLLGEDVAAFAKKIFDDKSLSRRVKDRPEIDFSGDWAKIMLENTQVTGDGLTIMRLASEDLGIRISKQAKMLANLEEMSVDFSNAMNLFVDFHEKADLLLVPLRRAARNWSNDGHRLQNWIKKYVYNTEQPAEYQEILRHTPAADAPYGEYSKVGFDELENPSQSLRDLWNKYQKGDKEAGRVLKSYIKALAFVSPSKITSHANNLGKIIEEYNKNRLPNAMKSIEYGSMLASVEPVKAAAVTAWFDVLTDGASNLFRGHVKNIFTPGGDRMAKAEAMYGWGMIQGFGTALTNGLQVAFESARTGKLFHANEKITDVMANKWRQTADELDIVHEKNLQKIRQEGKGLLHVTAENLSHLYARLGNSQFTNSFMRGLSAVDQGVTTNLGIQHAYGNAYREAFLNGHIYDEAGKKVMFGDKTALERYIDGSILQTFRGGLQGRLIDKDIMATARKTTLSSEIQNPKRFTPTAKNPIMGAAQAVGNQLDITGQDTFSIFEKGSRDNIFFRAISPFTRPAYTFLDTAAQAIAAAEPTGFLTSLVPRFQAIASGEEGVAQMMKFRANGAKAQLLGTGIATLAWNGYYLGQNVPAGMENARQSIILPNAESESGYTAVPIGRFAGPLIVFFDLIADTVNAFKDHAVTSKEYEEIVSEITASLQASVLDQSFVQGLERVAAVLDTNNPRGLVDYLATQGGLYSGLGLGKQGFRLFQPYETYGNDPNNLFNSWQMVLRQRLAGGVGNPVKFNIYTGNPKVVSGTGSDNYFRHVLDNTLNTVGWEQGVVDVPDLNPSASANSPSNIFYHLKKIGFDDSTYYKRTTVQLGGSSFKLNGAQRAALQRLMGDPKAGDLSGKLNALFTTRQWRKGLAEYEKFAAKETIADGFMERTKSKDTRAILQAQVRSIYANATRDAFIALIKENQFPKLIKEIKTEELRRLGQY